MGLTARAKCAELLDLGKRNQRRIRRTVFEHELQLRSVITAGSDLLAAKPVPNRAMLRGMSTRRRSYSSAIQLAAVRH